MNTIFKFIFFLFVISKILSHTHVSKKHKPHYFHRLQLSDTITKEELEHFLQIEYIIDGDKKEFGELNDVLDLKSHAIYTRNNKVIREPDRTIHIVVGDPTFYYCLNILAPFLSKGQKVKITCPNAVPSKSFVGRIPYKTMDFEIEVEKINKAWKLKEIQDVFKVEYLSEGETDIYPRLSDVIQLNFKMYHANTHKMIYDSSDLTAKKFDSRFILGHHDILECFEIVLPTCHLGQRVKFYCPQKYLRYEKHSGKEEEFEYDHDVYLEGVLDKVTKYFKEDL